MDADISIGDTIRNLKFIEDSRVEQFDKVIANPMWNQKFPHDFNYPYNSLSGFLHQIRALTGDGFSTCFFKRKWLVVVIDTGVVTRGSGSSGTDREKEIRRKFVEKDLIEAVILPDNLFYNST